MSLVGNRKHTMVGDALATDEATTNLEDGPEFTAPVAMHRCSCGALHWWVAGPIRWTDEDRDDPFPQHDMTRAYEALEHAAWEQDCPAAKGGRYRRK